MEDESFGKRIYKLRKEAGLTQKKLAQMLGVSEPAVCKWEAGSSMPDVMLLAPLARVLHTDLNKLFAYEETLSEKKIEELIRAAEAIRQEEPEREASYADFKVSRSREIFRGNAEMLQLVYVKLLMKHQIQGKLTEEQRGRLEEILLKLTESKEKRIQETAHLHLVSFYIRIRQFDKAKGQVEVLSPFDFNARHMKALLHYEAQEYAEGLKVSEQFLLECVQNALICLSHMADAMHLQKNRERELFFAEAMCQLEALFQIPFYRGMVTKMSYYVRQQENDKAVECFETYVDNVLCMEEICEKSEFASELGTEAQFISNGELVSLGEYKKMLLEMMQNSEFMNRIRKEERFEATLEQVREKQKSDR